ncbi:MAG: class I SAM-dependent methyltransferase [Chloroflexi bacterium]|nr:class I SAM-dependent methyltransferase [Chloroflexota bacterium]
MGMLNGAATALGLSVGHRTGAFDTMSGLAPSSSQQIADAAGLNERYVREWLNGMVVGGVVDYDAASGNYSLPAEHAASLTRAAGPGNIASMTQFLPLVAGVEDEIVDVFAKGGGVPYSSFASFGALMAESSAERFDFNLIDTQIPLVPGVVDQLEAGIDVADFGCGSGHAINLMAKQWPQSRFTGFDFSQEAIDRGRAEASAIGLTNANHEVQDVANVPGEDRFDFITTFDAVHDQANPAGMLESVARTLRPDGTYLCADIKASSRVEENLDLPMGQFFYTISLFHCMTVSLALDGEGLGAMWGEQKALEMLGDAGFTEIAVETVEGDLINNYYIATTG